MPIVNLVGQGAPITHYDAWRVHTNFTGDADPISSNWERVDTDSFSKLGSAGMSESSGIFTFPVTGVWQITAFGSFHSANNSTSKFNGIEIKTTANNSSYEIAARFYCNLGTDSGTGYSSGVCQHFFDVSNTIDYKVQFRADVENSSTDFDSGTAHTNHSQNLFTFIRFGDT